MRHLAFQMGLPVAAALGALASGAAIPSASAQAAPAPTGMLQINTGRGRLITMSAPIADVFVANAAVADVQVRSARQIYIFGKTAGETTIYATSKSGAVVYSTTVRIGNNIDSIDSMLRIAMPDAQVVATPMNGLVLLTGTVATPGDVAEAERLVQAFVGKDTQVITRLKTATPLQVNLEVRFAEVSRSFVKNIGVNLATRDQTSGFQFGIGSGRPLGTIGTPSLSNLPVLDASSRFGLPAGSISLPFDPKRGDFVYPGTGSTYQFTKSPDARTSIGLAGKLLGLDVLSALDLGETIGQVTTLTRPNLTALSGETSSFLAGGEIPILVSQGLGAVSVEYKQYGVSLAYTPTVLADGRISLRVKPEVSSLSAAGAVTVPGGTSIPALTTRRAETTVELGSGESMVIAGLLQNTNDNQIDKTPGLGDVPVLGALFRSNGFKRGETELVIVITPHLVKPVNANDIVLPTDGYKAPDDFQRVIGGQLSSHNASGDRPKPSMAPSGGSPSVGALAPAPLSPALQQPGPAKPAKSSKKQKGGSATPGFGL